MTGTKIDDFAARLKEEMAALTPEEISEVLVRIGRMDQRMRVNGQDRPIWRGPIAESDLLGKEVVVETETGTRIGRAICFGIMQVGVEYERSVIVHVPSSGTHHESPGSQTKLANEADLDRMKREAEMAVRLKEATASPDVLATRKPARRATRIRKDPAFIEKLLQLAKDSNNVKSIEDGSACHKITGKDTSKKLYLFKAQMRCNLSGYSIEHPAIQTLTPEEAREMHLGSVRGQIIFDDLSAAEAAFVKALEGLG